MKKLLILVGMLSLLAGSYGFATDDNRGNKTFSEFNKVKKLLSKEVIPLHNQTIYCRAEIEKGHRVELPRGFKTDAHQSRKFRYEIEHVVPVENFGKAFREWREGSPECVDRKGKKFKGRNCAQKVNLAFRFMQSDMYNLFPAIGSVNAARGHKDFGLLANAESNFGSCEMKIRQNLVEPPEASRGVIARAYLYMQYAYGRTFRMSKSQEKLMNAWNKEHPVELWECKRSKKIEKLQGNENPFVKKPCQERGWY